MNDTKKKSYAKYVAHLYPDGSVTVIWVWHGELKSIHYEPDAMMLTINNEDITWLVEAS